MAVHDPASNAKAARRLFLRAAGAGLLSLVAGGHARAQSDRQGRVYFRIATGPVTSPYFLIGGTLARLISQPDGAVPCRDEALCGVRGLSAAATATDGALANVRLVNAGYTESAFVQADILADAATGTGLFAEGKLGNLRAIANLFPQALHLLIAKSAKIESVTDLRGKRVAIDHPRAGANVDARLVLQAFGLNLSQIKLQELAPEQAASLITAGRLDALFLLAAPPSGLVVDLTARGFARLLPLKGPAMERLYARMPWLHAMSIPAKTYAATAEIETLGVDTIWVTGADMSANLVYRICRALFGADRHRLLAEAHPAVGLIGPFSAVRDLPLPLHDGARRYFVELGVIDRGGKELVIESAPTPRNRPSMRASQAASQ